MRGDRVNTNKILFINNYFVCPDRLYLNQNSNISSKLNMELPDLVRQLFAAKQAKGLSFADLEKILNRDEVWIAAVL